MYKLADGLKVEHARNHFFIVCDGAQKIIVLKDREAEILDKVTKNDVADVAKEMMEQYSGEGIEADIINFCNKLRTLGVLVES